MPREDQPANQNQAPIEGTEYVRDLLKDPITAEAVRRHLGSTGQLAEMALTHAINQEAEINRDIYRFRRSVITKALDEIRDAQGEDAATLALKKLKTVQEGLANTDAKKLSHLITSPHIILETRMDYLKLVLAIPELPTDPTVKALSGLINQIKDLEDVTDRENKTAELVEMMTSLEKPINPTIGGKIRDLLFEPMAKRNREKPSTARLEPAYASVVAAQNHRLKLRVGEMIKMLFRFSSPNNIMPILKNTDIERPKDRKEALTYLAENINEQVIRQLTQRLRKKEEPTDGIKTTLAIKEIGDSFQDVFLSYVGDSNPTINIVALKYLNKFGLEWNNSNKDTVRQQMLNKNAEVSNLALALVSEYDGERATSLVRAQLAKRKPGQKIDMSVLDCAFNKHPVPENEPQLQADLDKLSFKLTNDQLKTLHETTADMASPVRMYRLVQGEVSCGKTIIALLAIAQAVRTGNQSALLSPRQLLAEQSYEEAKKVFALIEPSIKVELLTSATPRLKRKQILQDLKSGKIQVLVGTHSIINKDIEWENLGLSVIDEQGRFGVHQRDVLAASHGHVMEMTATPIPRTLQMTKKGTNHMDYSDIHQMPPNRRKAKTHVAIPEKTKDLRQHLAQEVRQGRKMFWVCPRIDKGTNNMRDVTKVYEDLPQDPTFKGLRIEVLHGKQKPEEKSRTLQRFRDNEIDILISTAIVELGLHIEDLTLMVIEDAQSFALSQLHQLRGRIERSRAKSDVYMMGPALNHNHDSENPTLSHLRKRDAIIEQEDSLGKLRFLETCSDCFEIADEDLKRRGRGSLYGTEQKGRDHANWKPTNIPATPCTEPLRSDTLLSL